MKKNLFLSILASTIILSFNAYADVNIRSSSGNLINIKTPIISKSYDDVNDLYIAVGVGDINFIKERLKQDPAIFFKYNEANPEEIAGFNPRNLETLQLVMTSDKNLLNRIEPSGRNIISSMLFNYWDSLTHKEDIAYFNAFEKALPSLGITQPPGQTIAIKNIKDIQEITKFAMSNMSSSVLNSKDQFGNSALHYAVGRRMPSVVKLLNENSAFSARTSFNKYAETPIFMLVDNSCQASASEKVAAREVLKIMLDARTSLFQKNISKFSFPALVYGLPNLNYLSEILDSNLTSMQKQIFKNEAMLVKNEINRGDDKKLYTSIQRNGYWTSKCKLFENKKSKY